MPNIVVLGSLNVDLVQRVSRIPRPGETLHGSGPLEIFMGGKGMNQACAAATLGAHVNMAGKVGSDVFAPRVTNQLRASGVAMDLLGTSQQPSGTAMIFVLPGGENIIVIAAGANGDISVDYALEIVNGMAAGDLLLCQLEIPLEAVTAAITAAHAKGITTILDPAPASALSDDLLRNVSILTPNQTEAAILLGASVEPNNFDEALSAARSLQARGPETVIVKLGAAGCLVATGPKTYAIPGFKVHAVDTTAAGDTFNGALAASLTRGNTLPEAALFANAAAALSVTRPGAIASIPELAEVEQLLATQTNVP